MKIVNNMKLGNKLILMLLFPLLGLMFFSVSGIQEKRHEVSELKDVQAVSRLAVRISALVHETQKERGATALYLGSKGTKFIPELAQQRDSTDKRITELQGFLEGFEAADFGVDFKAGLDSALRQLDNISGKRENASAMTISGAEAIGYYTNMNASFLDVIAHMARTSSNAEVGTMTAAYVNFLMGKERAGIERAVLSNTFARDNFGTGMFNKFSALVTAQETYTNVFHSFADVDQEEFYVEKMQGRAVEEVQIMRDIAFERAAVGGFGVEAPYWFKTITKKINLLKEVEDYLSAGLNEKAASLQRTASREFFLYVTLTLGALLLAALLAVVIMRSIKRPLKQMVQASQRLAQGDVDVVVDVASKDEIGKLGQAFEDMVLYMQEVAHTAETMADGDLRKDVAPKTERDVLGNSFKKMVGGLRAIVGQVRGGADEIASATAHIATASELSSRSGDTAATAVEEISATMHEISANIQNVARNIQKQSASVSETSIFIMELINSIQRVAETSNKLADIARESAGTVASGKEAVDLSAEGVKNITGVMNDSAETIRMLGSRTKDIGKIIDVINDIAEQTNLLALNAAIEAARAGEHGMGFAVVADEVRKLAERSATSTAEISELIYGIQKEATTAVKDVEKNVGAIEGALKLSDGVVEALQKIEESVSEVTRYSQDIKASMGDQAEGCEQISAAVANLTEITQEISSSADEQASGTEEVVQSVEQLREMAQSNADNVQQLAASAEQMSRQAETLNGSVSKFTVDTAPKGKKGKAAAAPGAPTGHVSRRSSRA